jgi:hypothetical protein
MSKEVSGNLTVGLSKTAVKLSKLLEQYQRDYNNTFDLYEKSLNQVDGLKKSILATELEKNTQALANLVAFNTLLDSGNLDSQLKGLSTGANGQSKITGSAAGLSNGQTNFLKAVSNLRNTRKEQLKSLDTYKKAMASNGDKDRTAKMASVSKKFSDNFARGNSNFSDRKSSASSQEDTSTPSGYGAGDDKTNSSANAYAPGTSSFNGTGSLFGAGTSGNNSKSSNTETSGSGSGGVSDADRNKLSDAVDARDKNKDKYQSSETNTLFEKVTNAYIRNYDKVLTKKKEIFVLYSSLWFPCLIVGFE